MSDGLEWFTVGVLGRWAAGPKQLEPHDHDKKAQIRNAALVVAVDRKLVKWDVDDCALARSLSAYLQTRDMSETEVTRTPMSSIPSLLKRKKPFQPKRPRGRGQKYNPEKDEKLVKDWHASGFRTQAEFERERGLDAGHMKKAIDRDRFRKFWNRKKQ